MKKLLFLLPWLVVVYVSAQDFHQTGRMEILHPESSRSKVSGNIRKTSTQVQSIDEMDVKGKHVTIDKVNIPTNVKNGEDFIYTIDVLNQGTETIQTIEVETTVDGVAYIANICFVGELPPNTINLKVSVEGTKMCGHKACELTSRITKVDGEENHYAYERVNWGLVTINGGFPQNAVYEESTGTWCGWCTRGILTCEYIRENYGDRIFPIAIHSRDEMQIDEYNGYLSDYVTGYPEAMVNRSTNCSVGIVPTDRLYAQIKDKEAYARVSLKANIEERRLKIQAETEFAMDSEIEHRLSFVVVEDRVGPYFQVNSYNYGSLMGIWDVAGPMVSCYFNDVARHINTYEGIKGSLPDNITAGTKYNYETGIELTNVNSPSCRVIAMLINSVSGEIINSDLITVYPNGFAHFDKNELNLVVGESLHLTPTIAGYDGDANRWVWSSSNEDVVKVDNSGNVIGVGWGNAIITASCPQGTAQCDINVSWLGRTSVLEGVYYRLIGEDEAALSYNQSMPYPLPYGMESLTVPSEIEMYGETYKVSELEPGAFSNCISIKELKLPSSVRLIESYALSGCTSVSFVELNEGLKELGEFVFKDCNNLTEITLPASLEEIGENIFMGTPLTMLKMSRMSPPVMKGEVFSDDTQYGVCELAVPQESIDEYRAHPIFGKFANISGFESGVDNVYEEAHLCDVYSIGGSLVAERVSSDDLSEQLLPGIYIIRYSDGRTKKIAIK